MLQKIYIGSNPLILCTELTPEINELLQKEKTILVKELNPEKIKRSIEQLQDAEVTAVVICYPVYKDLFNAVAREFVLVKAAGGFVYTLQNKVLLIFRRKKWDLPKGKLDEGEDLATCAVREVVEETGLKNVVLKQPLIVTYHTYYEQNKHILKESHWFLMLSKEQQELSPQIEEDIELCEWIKFENIPAYLDNSLASIKDVLEEGIKKVEDRKSNN